MDRKKEIIVIGEQIIREGAVHLGGGGGGRCYKRKEKMESSLVFSAILCKTSCPKTLFVICNRPIPAGSIKYPSFSQLCQPWH